MGADAQLAQVVEDFKRLNMARDQTTCATHQVSRPCKTGKVKAVGPFFLEDPGREILWKTSSWLRAQLQIFSHPSLMQQVF